MRFLLSIPAIVCIQLWIFIFTFKIVIGAVLHAGRYCAFRAGECVARLMHDCPGNRIEVVAQDDGVKVDPVSPVPLLIGLAPGVIRKLLRKTQDHLFI